MTTRHAGYVVTLAEDIREDDTAVVTALRMVKGVISVTPVVGDFDLAMAESRARSALERRIYKALREPLKDGE